MQVLPSLTKKQASLNPKHLTAKVKYPLLLKIKNARICMRRSWKILISIKASTSYDCAKRTKKKWRKIKQEHMGRIRASNFRTYPTYLVRAREDQSTIRRRNLPFRAKLTFQLQLFPKETPRSKKSPHCKLLLLQFSQLSNNFKYHAPLLNQSP